MVSVRLSQFQILKESMHIGDLRSVRANKNCYRSTFLPWTIPEWNNLPDEIRNALSLDSFKNLLKNKINTKDLVQTSHYCCYLDCWIIFPLSHYQLVFRTVVNRNRYSDKIIIKIILANHKERKAHIIFIRTKCMLFLKRAFVKRKDPIEALFTRYKLTRARPNCCSHEKVSKTRVNTNLERTRDSVFYTQACWLHSQVKFLYFVIKSIVL